jgi:microcystin-dependent protein
MDQYGEASEGMHPGTIAQTGQSQTHENRQPYLATNYIISLYGIFPSQTKALEEAEYMILQADGSVSEFEQKSTEPFLAEVKIFSFPFAPKGWAMCNGQLLPINQNQALFSLVGTMYGGDGQVNFALPNIRGRVPVHMGHGWTLGEQRGTDSHALTINEMPAHNHLVKAVNANGTHDTPIDGALAVSASGIPSYSSASSDVNTLATSFSGQSQPHENRQPYLVLNFCIALQGLYPSPNKEEQSESAKGYDSFIAEISMFAFNFAPNGYSTCAGQVMPLSQNTALFALLGTMYGGDGKSTFALPDIEGRVVLHPGQGPGLSLYDQAEKGGVETVSLLPNQLPSHSHLLTASGTGVSDDMGGFTFGPFPGGYSSLSPNIFLHETVLLPAGGNQGHNNIMPSIGLNFCIALQGIFPPRW